MSKNKCTGDNWTMSVADENNKVIHSKKVEFFDDMIGFRFDHFETEPKNLKILNVTRGLILTKKEE